MKKRIILLKAMCLMFIIILAYSCRFIGEDFGLDTHFNLYNESSEVVYFACGTYQSSSSLLSTSEVFKYRDLTKPKNDILDRIPINENREFTLSSSELENGMQFHLLIYKQSTLDKFSIEELIDQNIFDKRYVLTNNDLKAMDFKIVYTGE